MAFRVVFCKECNHIPVVWLLLRTRISCNVGGQLVKSHAPSPPQSTVEKATVQYPSYCVLSLYRKPHVFHNSVHARPTCDNFHYRNFCNQHSNHSINSLLGRYMMCVRKTLIALPRSRRAAYGTTVPST